MKKIQLLLGISFFMFGCQNVQPAIIYKDDITIEYGHEIKESDIYVGKQDSDSPTIQNIKNFDAFKIGKQRIELVLSDGRKDTLDVCVMDTKRPRIRFKQSHIITNKMSDALIKHNIYSVMDDIDGQLSYVDHPIDKNGYYIAIKDEKVGIYSVTVHAFDCNGNHQEASFTLEEKKEVKKDLHKDIPVLDDNKLTPPRKKPSHEPSENQKKEEEKHEQNLVHTHDFDASGYENIIWSNKIFDDTVEALNWAEQYALEQEQWSIGGYAVAYCSCGKCQPFFFGVQEWKS